MKNLKFLLALFAVVVVMASCASTQGAFGDDYDNPRSQQIGNRVYMQDPYYGTIVLERDPYTGRYYDVTPGSRFGYSHGYPYGSYYNRSNRVYRGNNRNYGGNGNVVRPKQPSREEIRRDRDATRNKVLGN